MNDTLDYFTVSQIDNFIYKALTNIQPDEKNNSEDINKNISFDDSLFFDSQILLCDEQRKDKTNLIDLYEDVTIPKNNFKEDSSNATFEEITTNSFNDVFENSTLVLNNEEDEKLSPTLEPAADIQNETVCTTPETENVSLADNILFESQKNLPETCIISDLPSPNENYENIVKSNLLSSWGLPELVLKSYEKRNITLMFDWQIECLSKMTIVKNNRNLVYSAPTSAGKTLVAEILAMKCLFERKKKVLFILPFISVVREKMYYFQDILNSSGKRVEGFMGSYNPPGGFQSIQMAVGTIEKCNSLINRLLEENKLEDIGLVIIDEIHLIGDPHRGYLLELLITKLKYIMSKNEEIQIQIVGMSATLPNLDILAKWLNAELYTTTFRPIPLHEMVYVNKELYNNELKFLRKLETHPELKSDTDDILQLCLETIEKSCSVLIFCPSKNWCENLAQQMAMAFWRIGKSDSNLGQILRNNLSVEKITEILEQLKYCPSGLDKILKNTVAFGVAFHHAGLTLEERDIIEGGFRNGGIKLLIATSTLSSGVNLPARRVIIRSPLFNGKPIDILTYRQMIGRAGRMGIDTEGQSILICQKNDYNVAKLLTQSSLRPVQSCLEDVSKFKRAVLEIIASGVASTPDDLSIFEKSTLISVQNLEITEKVDPIKQVIEYLNNFQFIRLQTMDDGSCRYVPTALGKACLSSSLPPGEGLELFTELEKARQCFVLETELHMIYLVTPYNACYQWSNIDWMFYLNLWEKLPISMKKVGELVGVRESFIVNATRGKLQDSIKLFIHKRFFVSLALQDLVNEKPLDEVAAKFNCNRGLLQSLQQSASTFAGMITSFCRQLGWSSIEILISQFQDRLQFGVNRDLLDLMRLPCLNSKQARAFYNSGIETLVQLANSDVLTIENILHKVVPFENTKEREGETEHELKQRNKLRTIWITGKQGLNEKEASILILNDARKYLEDEMGVHNIKWETTQNESLPKNESSDVIALEQTESQDKNDQISQKIEIEKENLNCNNNTRKNTQNNTKREILNDLKNFENLRIMSPKSIKKVKEIPITPKRGEEIGHNSSCRSLSDDDLFHESLEETIDKVSSLTVEHRKRLHESNPSSPEILKKQKIQNNETNLNCTTVKDGNDTPIDLSKFFIVEVGKHKELYESFCIEFLNQTHVAMALACSKIEENLPKIGINSRNVEKRKRYCFEDKNVDGITFTWDGIHVFYLNLETHGCDQKTEFLQKVLKEKHSCFRIFDCKEQIVMLEKAVDVKVNTKIEDPKVIDWMLDPDEKEKTLHALISKYCPEGKGLSFLVEKCKGTGSIGMNVENTVESKMRACVETLATWHLMNVLKEKLIQRSESLLLTYETEMSAILATAKMEISGIGIDLVAIESLIITIKINSEAIEKKIYNLAGRKFSITSSRQIAKVIGLGASKKISTKKQILEQSKHPIAELILLWRKLSCIIRKMIQPLISSIKNSRIHGKSIMHTSTGRISMHEPNIQNMAKDFEFINPISSEKVLISCRGIFVPKKGFIFLSADYCQLELRMLAHLSKDKLLCEILNKKGDIFKSLASKWNQISEDMVTETLRNQTKQICYGIIYGIGNKALAEQLKIEEEEAANIMETFKNTYPGLNVYIQDVINNCKTNGYIETLSGRHRNLPNIDHENSAIRSHTERQAVNSTIQGSAADLVKKAMKKIEENFHFYLNELEKPSLVLHLHDELLYEIDERYFVKIGKIIRKSMESSVDLLVPFPVKIKTGYSWNNLKENCDIF